MSRAKKVVAVKPNGDVAGVFDSISQVYLKYRIGRSAISLCCRKARKSGYNIASGFMWYFEEDFQKIYAKMDKSLLQFSYDEGRDYLHRFKKGFSRKYTEEEIVAKRKYMAKASVFAYKKTSIRLIDSNGTIYDSINSFCNNHGLSRNKLLRIIKKGIEIEDGVKLYFLNDKVGSNQGDNNLVDN